MSYKTGFYEGRLGIGLGSTMGMGDGNPRYPLDINGDIRLTGSIVNGDGQVLSLVPAESLWTIGNNNLSYAGGNVGIGTQSPTTLLEIKGDGDANNNQIIIQSESYNKGILFKYKSATGTTYDFNLARIWTSQHGAYDTKLHFSTAKNVPPSTTPPLNEAMTIDADGNVGIGTTSPETLLTVGNHAFTDGTRDLLRFPSYRHNEAFTIRNNDDPTNGRLEFFWGNSQNGSGGHDNTVDKSILTLRHDGNVGIGTTSPTQGKLVVNGSSIVGIYSMGDYTDYNYILNGPRPGNTAGGAVHFINHASRTTDGGQSCYTIRNDNGPIRLGRDVQITTIEGSEICLNSNVGIGTTSPSYPLHVHSSVGASNFTYYGYLNNTGTWSGSGGATHNGLGTSWGTSWGIYCNEAIAAEEAFYVVSDSRIKENIVDVPDNLALQMVRALPCKYYEYKDKKRGSKKTIGFIAQEVKEILPMAVSIQTGIIPNEMRDLTDISWNDTTLYTDLSDCSGIKYRFFVSNDPSGNDEIEKVIVGNSDNTFTFDTSYNNVFCYGKEVDDFHTISKEKIFALNFSATQELDRKVIALENENAELKAELAAIKQHLGI